MGNESINWDKLGFDYIKTDKRYLSHWRDGAWDAGTLTEDNVLHISEGSTALHYGQQCFEGLKAYRCKDGSINLFRPDQNAARMQRSCARLLMPHVETEQFVEACKQVVRANERFIPPYGTGGALSTEALAPTSVPKHLVVVGGGYIGLELGIAYRKLGAEVSVVEAQERILPAYDGELTQPVHEALKQLGVKLYLKHSVEGFDAQASTLQVRDPDGETLNLDTDRVLVAVGRKPNTQGWNLEALDLAMNGSALKIDNRCQTSMRNVWAIGDLSGEPMLAHRAMAQGEMVAELIAGQHREFNPTAIAAVCFTDPELVVVGKTPDEAKAAGLDCIVSSFPFAANGRAMTLESKSGFVRVVARRDNHLIVGWQAVGVGVSELSTAFGQSLEMGARLEDIAGTIHAHPTLGEAVQEAALRALGHALHL
ncbi:FAD-dependent oxidoreductase [Pseudomonas brassicacearum]|uniref:FAD-dependent oxidoreductase n=1 Tax=Pseudomonas brassicacearum TaxID=930166 RepID=UPI000B12A407|nr:FAD-dependent oxidoreductase [Pseudomonas brassicacearum]